jgi:AcrR family transcriptional regulator
LLSAASRVFAMKGLQRARMIEIAEAAGVAPGTLYYYFESKEALFYYVLERGTGAAEAEIPEPLPVPDPGRDRLEKLLRSRATRAGRFPALDRALERRRVSEPRAELAEITAELFDRMERGRKVADILEASTLDHPELSKIWFSGLRRDLIGRLTTYVERRSARGHFRVQIDAAVTARFMLETCVYFARKRHRDPYPEELPDSAAVRATVVDLIVHSLIAPGAATST